MYSKTNIFGLLWALATILPGCSGADDAEKIPQSLVLSANKNELKSDGVEIVTFSIHADGKEVSTDSETVLIYKEENRILSDKTFSTHIAGTHHFYATYKNVGSPEIQITAIPVILTLASDKTSIKADGKDAVTFIVRADEDDVTNNAVVYRKEGEESIRLGSNTFITDKEGHHEFFAQYREQVSNTFSLEAILPRLSITPDKTSIRTGENVTFTAISDDVNDVSSSITLYITRDGQEEILNGPIFTPSLFGIYSIYATFEERRSNITEIEVTPASVALSVDKSSLRSTGADIATFFVHADGAETDDAEIFMKGEPEDLKLAGKQFSTHLSKTYTFYAQYAGVRSEDLNITVYPVNFYKQSCAMEFVATWCKYSPQMISAFHQVRERYSDHIQILSLHRSSSALESTNVDVDKFQLYYGRSDTPFGIMDFNDLLTRRPDEIQKSYQSLKIKFPATSGIAILSKKTDNRIDITLKVRVNETNEYSVYAFVVEDDVTARQLTFGNSSNDPVWNDNYVHHAVATYAMPDAQPYTGKSLGILQNGEEAVENFSIPLDNAVTKRTVNYSNCRVIAYILKKSGDHFYINNTASCPINGSIDYKYEE
jgi:thiol-disulfide isomerase/thioredoxin